MNLAVAQVKTLSFLVHLMRNAVNIAQMHKGSWEVCPACS